MSLHASNPLRIPRTPCRRNDLCRGLPLHRNHAGLLPHCASRFKCCIVAFTRRLFLRMVNARSNVCTLAVHSFPFCKCALTVRTGRVWMSVTFSMQMVFQIMQNLTLCSLFFPFQLEHSEVDATAGHSSLSPLHLLLDGLMCQTYCSSTCASHFPRCSRDWQCCHQTLSTQGHKLQKMTCVLEGFACCTVAYSIH